MAREKVSERDFILSDGAVVKRMDEAAGARYTLVDCGKSFDYYPGKNPEMDKKFAIFGFHTKVGNVANTVLNDKNDPGTSEDAAAEIDSWLQAVEGGTWREAGEGGPRGPKYDNAILAVAVLAYLKEVGDTPKGDEAYYLDRLESDKGYRAKVVARDRVKALYWAEAAKRGIEKPDAKGGSIA